MSVRPESGPLSVEPESGPLSVEPESGPMAATDGDVLDDEGLSVGRLAATVERLRRQIREAQQAADGRGVLELARGILVERLHCGPAEAARHLDDLAAQAGRTPLELAADIINQAARDRVTEATQAFLTHAVRGEAAAARAAGAGAASPDAAGGDTGSPDAAGGGTGSPGVASGGAEVATRLRAAESGTMAAADTQAAAEALLSHALQPLDAVAVAVWSAAADASLTLAGAAGFGPNETTRWRYVPPGIATPARTALLERRPVWFTSPKRQGLPSIGHQSGTVDGRVVVPAGTGGRIIGVLEVCWPGSPPEQSPRLERQLEALAELAAHTLETLPLDEPDPRRSDRALSELTDLVDGLHDSVMVLLPHHGADGVPVDFRIHHLNSRFVDPAGRPASLVTGTLLLESYPLAAESGGLLEKIERVHATGEPFYAERVGLTSLVGQVLLTAVADLNITRHGEAVLLVCRIQDQAARLANLLQHAQRLGRIGGFEENLITGEITWNSQLFELYGLPADASPSPLTALPAHAHPDDEPAIGRFLRTLLRHHQPSSAAFRIRRSDQVVRHLRIIAEPVLDEAGHLMAVRGAYQDVSAQHWTEVALAATRDQLAHTEQQAAERNRLALQLQRAIMPSTRGPLDVGGLQVAVRYRPAEHEHLVGGDWYEAVVLPSGQILLGVGDVAGHGIDAATGMVTLRNAMRGLAATGAGPAQLLGWLNLVAHDLTDHVTATALCALYDPSTRNLRWARAGHLAPVLIRDGDTSTLPMVQGLMLGALDDSDYEEGVLTLAEGDVLLLYTDGLVERRDGSIQDAMEHLLTTARRPAADLETRLDHLLTYSNADTDDDTCIVGIHLPTRSPETEPPA